MGLKSFEHLIYTTIQNNMYKDYTITSIINSRIVKLDNNIFFDNTFNNEIEPYTDLNAIIKKIEISKLFPQKETDSFGNILQSLQFVELGHFFLPVVLDCHH